MGKQRGYVPNSWLTLARKPRVFRLVRELRDAVMVMPKHLASIGAFSRFRDGLAEFVRNEYSEEMRPNMFDLPETETSAQSPHRDVA